MVEIGLVPGKIAEDDNVVNVEMNKDELWFLKTFVRNYNPKKIVEIGISAGGNTVNLLKWKNRDAKLFSIDISTQWYRDVTKLSGFMADELDIEDNWEIFRGVDYLEVFDKIGNDIDFMIIDTTHVMPGEMLTFLAALPQLKDGCIVVLHDIHLNLVSFSRNKFEEYHAGSFCTGLLFGGVSSNKKWILKSEVPNICAFVVDESTRDNIKDIFHILCSTWYNFPRNLDMQGYSQYIEENYSLECYNLFSTCLKLQSKYFNHDIMQTARVDIKNINAENNSIKILKNTNLVEITFPEWFKSDDGKGAIIQTKEHSFDLKFKCIKKGLLKIFLRGPDVLDEFGNYERSYIEYTSFKINNKDIIKGNKIVWLHNPYVFEKSVKNNEIIKLHVEWKHYSL